MFGKGKRAPRVKAKDIALPAAADHHPFSIVKGGYSVSEVAAFVSSMSVDMTTLTPQELRRASFSIERRGYDKAEVFAYLNRVAAEIEAELDAAREQARRERILTNDPSLAAALERPAIDANAPEDEVARTDATSAEPAIELIPRAEPGAATAEPERLKPSLVEQPDPLEPEPTEVIEPSPIESGMAPGTEVIYFAAPSDGDAPQVDAVTSTGREILWLTEDEIAAGLDAETSRDLATEAEPPGADVDRAGSDGSAPAAQPIDAGHPVDGPVIVAFTPSDDAPAPPPTPVLQPEPVVAAPEPEPVSPAPAPVTPAPTVADAATEIGELLRAAHDSATRLRANAEADIKATVDAARVEIDERTRSQHRELDDAKADAQRRHAEIIHNAQLTANETRATAELDAARTRAAADAVLAQARAEVEAVKALARHNLMEIEAAREQAIADATEMLGLGKSMLVSINDLDRDLAARVVHTQGVIGRARQALTEATS